MRELRCQHFSMKTPHLELKAVLATGEEVFFLFCNKCMESIEPRDAVETNSTADLFVETDFESSATACL